MTINDVHDDMKSLLSAWDGLLLNPRFVRRGTEISWDSYNGRSFVPSLASADVLSIASEKQYSFQLFDGSLIQFYYGFDRSGRQLLSANIGFIRNPRGGVLPPPESIGEEDDASVNQPLVIGAEEPDVAAWIRFDYSPRDWNGCVHGNCHMHTSMLPESRLPVLGVPIPSQFMEAVVAWFYPDEYRSRHLSDVGRFRDLGRLFNINQNSLDVEVDLESAQIPHIALPTAAALVALRNAVR